MEIGIHTENFHDWSGNRERREALAAKAYREIHEAGFDCADLTALDDVKNAFYTGDLETAKKLAAREREIAAAEGVRIHQVHGPWPTDDKTEENRLQKRIYMERAIRLTPHFGAKYLVIHPDMPFGWGEEPDPAFARETNLLLFRAILPIAEEEGVILCIENMPMTRHALSPALPMYEFVRELDHPNLCMCLDTGHANVFGHDCGDIVRTIAPVLKVLHVHDNMGDKDSHLYPFEGTVNWDSFINALREVGFDGVMSIESTLKERDMTADGHFEEAKKAANLARKLADAVVR